MLSKLDTPRRKSLSILGAIFILLGSGLPLFAVEPAAANDLENGFRQPPPEARCRVYWWWLNSNVTKESITQDLEAMHQQGIGGALLFDTDNETFRKNRLVPHGPDFGSAEYRRLFAHACQEADRLGIELSFLIQSGWNLGGPSVTPEEGAKLITWSETKVDGAKPIEVVLPKPKNIDGFYRDIAVLAYPQANPQLEDRSPVTYTVSADWVEPGRDASCAADGDPLSYWCTDGHKPGDGPTPDRPNWLLMKFSEPITATSLEVIGRKGYGPKSCELQVRQGKGEYRTVKKFEMKDKVPADLRFDAVQGDSFRLMFLAAYDAGYPDTPRHVAVQEIALRNEKQSWPPRPSQRRPIRDLNWKIAAAEVSFSTTDTSQLLADVAPLAHEIDAPRSAVADVTSHMDASGRLKWNAPMSQSSTAQPSAGQPANGQAPNDQWHILRIGYSSSGAKVVNGSGGWGGRVLDHLDTSALLSYWQKTVEPFVKDPAIAPFVGKSWKYVHSDSWEMGGMNWSAGFRQEFQKRRGYDLLKYLPVLAGRIIDNRDVSSRFLNDYRRTIAECIAENHYAAFTKLAHENELLVHAEAGGPHGAPIDALQSLGYSDVPMMEFWAKSPMHRVKDIDRFFVKQAASAAHIYGKLMVAAEGETTIGTHWEESFRNNLKPTFDRAVCEGLNRLVFHQFTSSPAAEGLPGQEYFAGTHFSPRTTWWPLVHGWLDYVNRCQFMMMQGQFVADVCYYNGDNIPNMTSMKDSDPAGVLPEYDYDAINQDVLLNRLTFENGQLVLPSGMRYRVLVLPTHRFISLEALRKIARLVEEGAVVVGPKPTALTGLREYPQCDQELASLTQELWGDCDGKKITQHAHGKGKVYWGKTVKDVLRAEGVAADFEPLRNNDKVHLDFIHRRSGDTDIYFVANRDDRAAYCECAFRVKDKSPELWEPYSGAMRKSLLYKPTDDGRVTAPVFFEPYGSAIIVFRSPSGRRAVALSKDGQPIFPLAEKGGAPQPVEVFADGNNDFVLRTNVPGKYEIADDRGQLHSLRVLEPKAQAISGPWTVQFTKGWGAPESTTFETLASWTESSDTNIKYFSGIATYTKEIDIPAEMIANGRRLELDLGKVQEMAEVSVNGKSLGAFWKPPFAIDIGAVAKAGKNSIEVRVANHWRNRLIGDAKLSTGERRTKTNVVKYESGSHELLPSGLMGPVVLRSYAVNRQALE